MGCALKLRCCASVSAPDLLFLTCPYFCRAQVSELLVAGNSARCEADTLRQAVKARDLDLDHMTLALKGVLTCWLAAMRQGCAVGFENEMPSEMHTHMLPHNSVVALDVSDATCALPAAVCCR